MTEPTELDFPEQDELQLDELTLLKQRAQTLGIKFHPSIGLESLRSKVSAALTGEDAEEAAEEPVPEAPAAESRIQMRNRLRKEASALVRVRVTCMNPNKKEWKGEIFTASNSIVGTFRKYVQFNTEEGWHVPQIILNMIKARQFQTFYTIKNERGVAVRKGKLVPEFAVEVLPPLTEKELLELSRRQALAGGVE